MHLSLSNASAGTGIVDITIEGMLSAKSCGQLVLFSQSLLGLLLVRGLSKLLALYKGSVAGLGVSDRLWAVTGKAATKASKEPPGNGDILPWGSSLPLL